MSRASSIFDRFKIAEAAGDDIAPPAVATKSKAAKLVAKKSTKPEKLVTNQPTDKSKSMSTKLPTDPDSPNEKFDSYLMKNENPTGVIFPAQPTQTTSSANAIRTATQQDKSVAPKLNAAGTLFE